MASRSADPDLPRTGPTWLDDSARDELRREAKVVGLRNVDAPSLEAVERRRVQLWSLSTVLLLAMAAMVMVSAWWDPGPEGVRGAHLVLRVAVIGLTAAFAAYSFEKEAHLRRLSHLLLDERLLTIALSNRLRELSLLLDAGKAMNSLLELPQVLAAILRSSLELLGGSGGSVMLLDENGLELHTACAAGNEEARDARQEVGRGIAGKVAETGQPLLVNGTADGDTFPGLRPRRRTVDSAMSVPLVHHEELLGVLNINAGPERRFTEYDLRALSLFAEQAASTIVKARLFDTQRSQAEELERLAFQDSLTGLANRPLFIDRTRLALSRTQRHPGVVAVLFVDLDHFKVVNDRHGHAAGDELLVAVADRIRAVVRPSDTVARFGGDEFLVLCESLAGPGEAHAVAARIEETLGQPFRLVAGEARLTASVGVALAADHRDDPEAIVRAADAAMYLQKRGVDLQEEAGAAGPAAEATEAETVGR